MIMDKPAVHPTTKELRIGKINRRININKRKRTVRENILSNLKANRINSILDFFSHVKKR